LILKVAKKLLAPGTGRGNAINSEEEPFMLRDGSMRRTTIQRSMERVLKKK
jgi:hypothetical protein